MATNIKQYTYMPSTGCAAGIGDALLTPLSWCGARWNSLRVEENAMNIKKVCQIAQKILCGALLLIPTAIALVPGIVGAMIKPSFSSTEEWIITMDEPLKNACRDLIIRDTLTDIAVQNLLIANFGTLQDCPVSSVSIRRGVLSSVDIGKPRSPSMHVDFKINKFSFIFTHLHRCLQPSVSREEAFSVMTRLPEVVLGINPTPSCLEGNTVLSKKLASCSEFQIRIPESLENITVELIS